jgi:hypothetical protein
MREHIADKKEITRRIAAYRRQGTGALNLSRLSMAELPVEIEDLSGLTELDISYSNPP